MFISASEEVRGVSKVGVGIIYRVDLCRAQHGINLLAFASIELEVEWKCHGVIVVGTLIRDLFHKKKYKKKKMRKNHFCHCV